MWIFSAIANAIGRNFIGRPNYLFDLLFNRVQADGGVTEAQQCTIDELTDLQNKNLLSSVSLMLTPTSYKEGKLYSIIPENGDGDFTFTRATTATRVNSDGLVELVPYNLFQYSEDFSNAIWGKDLSSITYNQPDPFGGNNAALCTFTNLSASRIFQNYSIVAGNTYTLSAWIKGVNITEFRFLLGTNQAVFVTSQIVNGEWVRVSATVTATTTGTYQQSPARSNNTNGESFYIYGAQLVEGSNALPYQKTETRLNIPRLDYSSGTCPSLLVEPQRTNVLAYSNNFTLGGGNWFNFSGANPIANQGISPDGINNAWTLPSNSTLTTEFGKTIGQAIGDKVTASIYAKGSETAFNVYIQNVINTDILGTVTVNLTTGLITSGSGNVQNMGNGWYRISVTGTSTITNGFARPTFKNPNSACLIYGAQYEAGAYATSYIPTTSATVTRNADVISKTGISSLIGQTEGTLYAEVLQMGASTIVPFQISDTTNNNRAQIEMSNNGAAICVVTSGGVNTAIITGSNLPYNQYHKIAVTYKANEFKLYVNGSLVGTDTSGAVPISPSAVYIGSESGSSFAGFKMKSAIHWKEVLTADQLEALTGTSFNTYAEMASYYNYTLQ